MEIASYKRRKFICAMQTFHKILTTLCWFSFVYKKIRSLLILGTMRFYPLHQKTKKRFYVELIVMLIFGNIISANVIVLFGSSLINGDYFLVTSSFPFALAIIVVNGSTLSFAVNHKQWSNLFKSLTDCQKFGKPPNYDLLKKNGDRKGMIYMTCYISTCTLFAIIEAVEEQRCLKNVSKHEICGFIIPVWWPTNYHPSTFLKTMVQVYEVGTIIILSNFTIIATLQYQVCEYIAAKAAHLGLNFNAIDPNSDAKTQFEQFKLFVDYHQHIISLCAEFDSSCKRTVGHVTFTTAAISALFSYHGMQGNYKLLAFLALYILNLGFMCHTGQNLEDAMLGISNSIYSSKWYELNIRVRQRIPFLLARTQKRIGLDAVPIGYLNYALFMTVLKTTCTYLNLLNHTI